MEKIKSRKLWAYLIVIGVLITTDYFKVSLDVETLNSIQELTMSYLGVQGFVDVVKVFQEYKQPKVETQVVLEKEQGISDL